MGPNHGDGEELHFFGGKKTICLVIQRSLVIIGRERLTELPRTSRA